VVVLTDAVGERLLQIFQAVSFTSDDERQHLWARAFDHLRPAMAFAHVSLVLSDAPRFRRGRRARRDGLARLEAARDRSLPQALPAEDRGPPLGQHIELDDPAVADTLRDLGPYLLRVQVFPDEARPLLRDEGPGAALPMLDVDDFGEDLTVHVPLSDLPAFLPLTANLSPAPPDTRTMWQKQQ